jgi:transposase
MLSRPHARRVSPEEHRAVLAERETLRREKRLLNERVEVLQQQLEWLKRQLFGTKSERRLLPAPAAQMSLGEGWVAGERGPSPVLRAIAAHSRRPARTTPSEAEGEPRLFFDERVPVEVIPVPNPATAGLAENDYEVIGEKVTHRLAQRPGSYVVLKYVRPVVKLRADASLHCPPAPPAVIEGSRADVSFIAGLLVDKFAYHLPLYRQHQRLADAGIEVSRAWLTRLVHRAAALLEPIYEAQLDSIRQSRVKAMDETPIKAGTQGQGKMKTGYFWPVYGEQDEIVFPFFPTRSGHAVREALGQGPAAGGAVLLSDGYEVYARYAEKTGITHAQCWAHTRRKFVQAEAAEPEAVAQALDHIGELYAVEVHIREQQLCGEAKRRYRVEHAQPVVETFFAWADDQFTQQGLLPSNPLTTALSYALARRQGLQVYLTDPAVPIDTNHLERALRAIPMGRKAWLFAWTEVGAKYVGILQSLLVTCRLHQVNPYDYFVDVLQRIDRHPASEVHLLTPRLWKQHFAANPLRSPLHTLRE